MRLHFRSRAVVREGNGSVSQSRSVPLICSSANCHLVAVNFKLLTRDSETIPWHSFAGLTRPYDELAGFVLS